MAEIENELKLTFNSYKLRLDTALSGSIITISGIQLSEDQGATLGYLINNPRNLLEAEIRLTGRTE